MRPRFSKPPFAIAVVLALVMAGCATTETYAPDGVTKTSKTKYYFPYEFDPSTGKVQPNSFATQCITSGTVQMGREAAPLIKEVMAAKNKIDTPE